MLSDAIRKAGSAAALARDIGVSRKTIERWKASECKINKPLLREYLGIFKSKDDPTQEQVRAVIKLYDNNNWNWTKVVGFLCTEDNL